MQQDIQEIKQYNTEFWINKLFTIFPYSSFADLSFSLNERNNAAS